eukprot:1358680-Amorphochlora_amoeboformis.AAC.1
MAYNTHGFRYERSPPRRYAEVKELQGERAHQREVKVYQEKIRELGIHNRRELEVARKRSEQ